MMTMAMQADFIEQLSAWLAGTDIEGLELRGPETLLRLRREGGRVVREADDAAPAEASVPATAPTTTKPVAATSVGVFLRQHPLHAARLVAPGVAVQAGQTLGLLQVGSLLLEVAAPQDGVVDATPVEHGTVVGYGATLFELQPLA